MTDFAMAVGLVCSYVLEDGETDAQMVLCLRTLRELYPIEHDKILVLGAAIQDERFRQYGLASAYEVLKDFAITNDIAKDVQRFLAAMFEEHVRQAGAEDPVLQAAERAVAEHGENVTLQDISNALAECGAAVENDGCKSN
jgi:hypothetical protein